MLSSRKKNIMIGLVALGLFGLVYSFLNSRPEMIADESLRVAEVPRPEFDRVINRPSAFKPDDSFDMAPIVSGLVPEGELQETGGEYLVSAMQESPAESNPGQRGNILADTVTVAPSALLLGSNDSDETQQEELIISEMAGSDEVVVPQKIAGLKDPYINPFKSGSSQSASDESFPQINEKAGASSEDLMTTVVSGDSEGEPFINLTNAEVPLLSEQQSGFLDLNLAEEKSLEITILEGDEIIIDDVNEALEKFQPLVSEITTEERSESSDESSTTTSVSQVSMDIVSPLDNSIGKNDVHNQSSELVILPDPDHELMSGTDEVSLEYQASYKKLESVTDKLKAANEENHSLKDQFSKVADDNRKLAQMIRDIDEEIKVLTAKN